MHPGWMSEQEWLSGYRSGLTGLQGAYLGFYSSIVDGFFREPWGYWIPVDDHLVHRGDGIFEAVRIVDRAYFDLDSHLARLTRSAERVSMALPFSVPDIRNRCLTLAKLCNTDGAVLRLYIGRGPGGFTTNPYEPKRSQLYMALTPWKEPPARWYQDGVRAGVSRIPGKRPFEATIKSCNYLQNVLQKKDALDRDLDFTVCLNENGEVLEGSTESFCVLTDDGELLVPSTEITLSGTTMNVVRTLGEQLVQEGRVKAVREAKFRAETLTRARELAFVGTTIGVCPVTIWESKPVGSGRVGEIAAQLGRLLDTAMRRNEKYRSAF